MDLWILVLPLKIIIRIPRPPREKIALFVIFGLGVISTIASVIRLQSLRTFTLSNDPFYDSLPINSKFYQTKAQWTHSDASFLLVAWSMVEVNIGILCASIPTLKPLVSRAQRHRTKHALLKYNSKNNAGGEWPGDSKVAILKTGKDMMISLHPSTKQGDMKSFDEEWELDDRPPPVPPKDDVFEPIYEPPPRYPDMAYGKF